MRRSLLWGTTFVLLVILLGIATWAVWSLLKGPDEPVTIPAEKVAEYVHAVIEANRTVYATNVVDKMQEKGIVEAAEHWRQENALPLPAQFLIDTGRVVAERGVGIRYRLASLSPIYVLNNPQSDFERKGLEAVARNPDRPFTGFVRIGRERVFQAIYADRAVAHACAECHNRHPNSPRRDYKLNDVMGGIVITIPAGP